jgi:hypothetical protein
MGRTDLADQLLGHGLDVADQQIVVDLFEWRFVGGRDDPRASSSQVNFVISRPQRRIFRERDRGFESTSLQERVTCELGYEAAEAFRAGGDVALSSGADRDLSVSYVRVGDVLVARGNLPEALKSCSRKSA